MLSPGIIHLFKELWFFLMETGIQNLGSRQQGCSLLLDATALGPLSGQSSRGLFHMYIGVHTCGCVWAELQGPIPDAHPCTHMCVCGGRAPGAYSICTSVYIHVRACGQSSRGLFQMHIHVHTCACVCAQSVRPNSATPWTAAACLPHPWDRSGERTGVSCHFLLQGIFPTQGLIPLVSLI